MTQAISISKAKILNYIQCARRLWLEQYNPELEDPTPAMDDTLEQTTATKEKAHRLFDDGAGIKVDAQRGLRSALEQTRSALQSDATVLFDAAFEFDAVVVQVDILERGNGRMRLIKVCPNGAVPATALDDCAIQAWTLRNLGHDNVTCEVTVLRGDPQPPPTFENSFELHDVTDAVNRRVEDVASTVAAARKVLDSLDEPSVATGPQCQQGYPCPFLAHCTAP